jgi:hypothetical protein
MIAYGSCIDLNNIVEIIHNATVADQLRRFNASFELIASVKIQNVAFVLIFDSFYHLRHILKPSVGVGLIGATVDESHRKGSSMNVI